MNRRLFFAALAGLPFVGRLVPKPKKPRLEFSERGGPVLPPSVPCAPWSSDALWLRRVQENQRYLTGTWVIETSDTGNREP